MEAVLSALVYAKVLEEHSAVADLDLIDRTVREPDERRPDPRPGRERFLRREGASCGSLQWYRETPGDADWHWWLGLLLGATCEVIDEAHMCDVVRPGPDPAISPGSQHRDQGEAMELAARSLVTSCVQTLALFGSPHLSTLETS